MAARITIILSDQPLAEPPAITCGCGGVVNFSGIVRGEEDGKPISALEYEAYHPMAERELSRIARNLMTEFSCDEIYIAHRFGIVPVGEAAVIVRAAAQHRGPVLSFVTHFMNVLKTDVPIWKVRAITLKEESKI